MNFSDYKRFVELYMGDGLFRNRFGASPLTALDEYKIYPQVKLEFLQELGRCCEKYNFRSLKELFPNEVAELNSYAQKLKVDEFSNICYNNHTHNRGFSAWKSRRFAANRATLNPRYFEKNLNISVAYELGIGCTGQCSFCCLAAETLKENFLYTPKNRNLWQNVLKIFRQELGEQASAAALYWATDPFDNPDIEKFYSDFYDINRIWPPLTTRVGIRNLDHLREFAKLGAEHGQNKIRLSIVKIEELRKFIKEFTATEALNIDLVLNNIESLNRYSISGRAREFKTTTKLQEGTTSCCLSGFLVNLCQQNVKLISPCVPSETNPMGYQVWSEFHFDNVEDLERKIAEVDKKFFIDNIAELPFFKLDKVWDIEENESKVCFKSPFLEREIEVNLAGKNFINRVAKGISSRELESDLSFLSYQKEILELLWREAMLDERV